MKTEDFAKRREIVSTKVVSLGAGLIFLISYGPATVRASQASPDPGTPISPDGQGDFEFFAISTRRDLVSDDTNRNFDVWSIGGLCIVGAKSHQPRNL